MLLVWILPDFLNNNSFDLIILILAKLSEEMVKKVLDEYFYQDNKNRL